MMPSRLRGHPDFVPAAGILGGANLFDHSFFGMSLREARLVDPQQRVFLELAWAAMEDAGLDPGRAPGRVSVYAGAANSGHLLGLLGELGDDPASLYEAISSATADNLATKVAFQLGLRGEAVTLHTACSTGLAVVHAACQSLLLGQSAVAIAGSVRIAAPQHTGYVYQEGMILSKDGHCRAFDSEASGTVPGNGAGVVILRPLDAAIAAGDHIYAVLKGSAINNDGHRSVELHRAQRTGPGRGDRRGDGVRRGVRRRHRLRRGPRHRDAAGRPDRDRRSDPGLPGDQRAGRRLPDRLGEAQHRAPRHRGRHRRAHQGRADAASQRDPADAAPEPAQPGDRLRRRPVRPEHLAARVATGATGRAGPGSARSASAAPTCMPCSKRRRSGSPRQRRRGHISS